MQELAEIVAPTPDVFTAILTAGEPVVIRGLARDWPVVTAARDGGLADYLRAMATAAVVPMVRAAATEDGRLHYAHTLDRPNFIRESVSIAGFLDEVARQATMPARETLAIQGLAADAALPSFAAANAMPLLPPDVEPRLWLGTPAVVATHHDTMENIACVAAGQRNFTLFAPEQVANLYMGPFHVTPAGTAVSMAHVTAPDFDRFPRFAEALATARHAVLDPGDAIYIPYGWYHHVEALAPLNLLVNYWWNPARRDGGSPWDAMMHGMMALRQLPESQRRSWRAMFDHYVFKVDADPGAHLPAAVRGVLGAESPDDLATMRRTLIASLQKMDHGTR